MRRTITPIDSTTDRASLGCVPGVNKSHQYPGELCLVFDKLSELVESPRVVLSPLAMSNHYSVSDTTQIFKSDTSASVFSLCNNPLTNHVIDVSSKPHLFTRTLYEKSPGCLRSFGLKFATEFRVAFSQTVDLIARIRFAIGISGNVHDTEVNPQIAVRVVGSWLRGIYHDCQIKDTISENKVGLPHLTVNPCFLIATDSYRDNLPTSQSQDRNLIQPLPRQNTLVVDHCRVGLEGMQRFPVSLIAFRDLGNCSYRHLSRKTVMLTKVEVDHVVKIVLAECTRLESLARSIVASLIKTFHRLKKRLVLFGAGSEFNHQRLFHSSIVDYTIPHVKYFEKERGAFLCQINQAVSCA